MAIPGNREESGYSVQYPIEGYKCLSGHSEILFSKHTLDFLCFTPLKGVLTRVTGFPE